MRGRNLAPIGDLARASRSGHDAVFGRPGFLGQGYCSLRSAGWPLRLRVSSRRPAEVGIAPLGDGFGFGTSGL